MAKRSEGGVSIMSFISLFGVAVSVFALVATLAVRTGYRDKFVETVLGANAHTTIHAFVTINNQGERSKVIQNYNNMVNKVSGLAGVTHAMPQLHAQLIAASDLGNVGIDLFGLTTEDIASIPLINNPQELYGNLAHLKEGIAIGSGIARQLSLGIGDQIRLISPNGIKTVFGSAPRINTYTVVYIFGIGRYDVDNTRVYMDLTEAQRFLNRQDVVDQIAVFVEDPERIERIEPYILDLTGSNTYSWSWKDSSGAFLQALQMEDNLMFIVMSILVLIATSNIVSGLVMLVKNKSSAIGILRSIGISQGSVLRIFFIYGAIIGISGTLVGVIFGCLFAIYIDPIFDFINWISRAELWDPKTRLLARLPAKLELQDIVAAITMSLLLTFTVTLVPARRAARMHPGMAIRYE